MLVPLKKENIIKTGTKETKHEKDAALLGMLHIRPDKNGLHYVSVVGYDDSAGCGKSRTEWGIHIVFCTKAGRIFDIYTFVCYYCM